MAHVSEPQFAFDAFASHRGTTHAQEVRDLVARLRRESLAHRTLEVFFDEDDVDRGSVVGELNFGLERSRHLLVCMTPDYFQSRTGWTSAEWHAVLYDDPDGRTDRVIPVLIATCNVPILLRHLKVVDLRAPQTDADRARYDDQYQRLVRRIKDEPRRRERSHGQPVEDGELAPEARVLARAILAGDADHVAETLRLNLLVATAVPPEITTVPLRPQPGIGGADRFPAERELRERVRSEQEAHGVERPFVPGFRRVGPQLVTFDRVSAAHPFAAVAETRRAQAYPLAEWLRTPDDRRVVVSLFNRALRSHANRLHLVSHPDEPHRFFFERPLQGDELRVDWRGQGRGRVLAKAYRDEAGDVSFWFHRAAEVGVRMLGRRTYLRIRPTVVFTRDGTLATVRTGPAVTRLAAPFTQRERNATVHYLLLLWTWILADRGQRLIRVRLGPQHLVFDARPVEILLPVGIAHDHASIEERFAEEDEEAVEDEEDIVPEDGSGGDSPLEIGEDA